MFALGVGNVSGDGDERGPDAWQDLVQEFDKIALALLWMKLVDMKIRDLVITGSHMRLRQCT